MNWFVWALLSAFFAGVTAVLAKVGVQEISSNLATAIRTVVILIFAWSVALFTKSQPISTIGRRTWIFLDLVWCRNGAVLALLLPGIATRRGVARRARRQVKRGHRDCAGGNFSARASYLAPLGRGITDLHRCSGVGLRVGRKVIR